MLPMLLTLLFACAGDKPAADSGTPADDTAVEGDADTDTDTDADADADSDTDADADLPEVRDQIDPTAALCQEFEGSPVAGAQSYYYGQYNLDGTGLEIWYLIANEAWKARGGADCEVVWSARWIEAVPSYCPTCEVGINTSVNVDEALTTCDPGLYEDIATFTELYEVDLGEDGTSTWFDQSAGFEFGWGYANSSAMNYLGEANCRWFGG